MEIVRRLLKILYSMCCENYGKIQKFHNIWQPKVPSFNMEDDFNKSHVELVEVSNLLPNFKNHGLAKQRFRENGTFNRWQKENLTHDIYNDRNNGLCGNKTINCFVEKKKSI